MNDKTDINCKTGTYWYDPIEFQKKIYYYNFNYKMRKKQT